MWYAFDMDACLGRAKTKAELLNTIRMTAKYRCKRIETGSYEYQIKDDDGYWYTSAYLFGSRQLALDNGFANQLKEYEDQRSDKYVQASYH